MADARATESPRLEWTVSQRPGKNAGNLSGPKSRGSKKGQITSSEGLQHQDLAEETKIKAGIQGGGG